jgi:phospholipase C
MRLACRTKHSSYGKPSQHKHLRFAREGSLRVRGNDVSTVMVDLRGSFGWYDLTITVDADSTAQWRIAGHVETGRDSMSDPALGS